MNVYEHGIVRQERLPNSSLRLIATTELPIYFGSPFAIVDLDGGSLTERAMNVAESDPTKPSCLADYYEESDLRYCACSMLYHLGRILELYAQVAQRFDEHHPKVTSGTTGDPRIYYEIEAFFDCAKRVYETIRKVLWKHYGRGGDRWSNILTVAKNPHGVPKAFVVILESSLSAFGKKVKSYRDCIAHCDPLNDGGTSCWTSGFEGRWGVTVKLPLNPDAKNRTLYNFEAGPDALSYCHSVANHLILLCEQLSELDAVRFHLDHPELAHGWLKSVSDAAASQSRESPHEQ